MRDELKKSKTLLANEGVVSFLSSVFSYLSSRIPSSDDLSPAVDDSTLAAVWYLKPVYNTLFRMRHGNGTEIMDEEWDTLVLLDACRYDALKRTCEMPGELESRISKGMDSPTFIDRNFSGKQFDDTVYVTANPHAHMIDDDNFYEVDASPLERWDPDTECVLPEAVTEAALEAHARHENKRILVHYMQPHDPPIGPTGRKLRSENGISGMRSDVDERYIAALKDGVISREDAMDAYRETLNIVLQEVRTLIAQVDGRVVVSADHGEMFGEKPYRLLPRLYEHYNNPKTTQLCKVPWLEIEASSERRQIRSGQPDGETNIETQTVEKQLEALGYR